MGIESAFHCKIRKKSWIGKKVLLNIKNFAQEHFEQFLQKFKNCENMKKIGEGTYGSKISKIFYIFTIIIKILHYYYNLYKYQIIY